MAAALIKTRALNFRRVPVQQQLSDADTFLETMLRRRTVRDFSSAPVPFSVIEAAIRTAATAPSGANQQPWHFVVVADPETKRRIRIAAEEEEKDFYTHRAPQEWLDALAPLGTDWHKPFLEQAPYLIVVFRIDYGLGRNEDGSERKWKHYYVNESVGISVGMLLCALHLSGLATLTHTPSPMGFLGEILGRPKNERAFVVLPVGYPAESAEVPDIGKKPLVEVMSVIGEVR